MLIIFFFMSVLLSCLPLLLSSATYDNASTPICPESFSCSPILAPFKYPFYNASDSSQCGLIKVRCSTSNLSQIQLGNHSYSITRRPWPRSFVFIKNKTFENLVDDKSCEALEYNFTSPTPLLFSISIFSNMTVYKCTNHSNYARSFFDRHKLQNYSSYKCKDHSYSFYYRYPIDYTTIPSDLPHSCDVIQLPVKLDPVVDQANIFSLLSPEFSIAFHLSPSCDGCHKKGGQCRVDNGQFHCLNAKNEKGKLKLKLILGVAGSGFILMLSSIIFAIWRQTLDLEDGSHFFGVSVFSYEELKDATQNFDPSQELGDGGFGAVYYGSDSDSEITRMIRLVAELAFRCLQYDSEMRPTMSEVLEVLEDIQGSGRTCAYDDIKESEHFDPPSSMETMNDTVVLLGPSPPPASVAGTLLEYPFNNASDAQRGLIQVDCSLNHEDIQLGRHPYQIAGKHGNHSFFLIPNRRFEELLEKNSSDALYFSFTSPTPLLFSISIRSFMTLFKCTKDPKDAEQIDAYFIKHGYNSHKSCKDHKFYYNHHLVSNSTVPSHLPPTCEVIRLPVKEQCAEGNETDIFSLLAHEFSIFFNLSSSCQECCKNKGQCQTNNGQLECLYKVAAGSALILMLLSCAIFVIWRNRKSSPFSYVSSKEKSPDFEDGSDFFGVSVFSYDELKHATQNFDPSRLLGDGGCVVDQLIDPVLGSDSDPEIMRMITLVAELAFLCLQYDSELRPTMTEVLDVLKDIRGAGRRDGYDGIIESKDSEPLGSSKTTNDTVGLLKGPSLSPVSVVGEWQSGSTTPSSNGDVLPNKNHIST
ncbi:Concanavalin A-like lectin/glucanase, subgroup [Cynara cardunculus var. scolymus]|uniref:Concanavalin A-like lectin/glucanase, subgroup n=1 Tax=Cynara cardunculus var. scolymus TaxID=59895 RepID=A0A103XCE6_CYNCS|nr:Concanavalin A-like lectin/glucanase, subgroup [Cynara cardunculus var. scolymus]